MKDLKKTQYQSINHSQTTVWYIDEHFFTQAELDYSERQFAIEAPIIWQYINSTREGIRIYG